MKHTWLLGLALLVAGCGGTRTVEVRMVQEEKKVTAGPAASAEEVSGEVPPLRALAEMRPLVPPELIPPEAPADPEPVFD